MALQVCNGAMLKCSMGVAPSTLVVLPIHRVMSSSQPAANIKDHIPMVNIMPFGMCTSPTNPAVISAMGAPVPCVPVTPMPWVTGAVTVLLDQAPALNNTSKLTCMMGGIIEVMMPGQTTHLIP
jgi:Domain of unknown function (DUF4280)